MRSKIPHPMPRQAPTLRIGQDYTVRVNLKVPQVPLSWLDGDCSLSAPGWTREVNSGTRMRLRHEDTLKGKCYLVILNTGEAVALDTADLTLW